jgi:hypothetical protein
LSSPLVGDCRLCSSPVDLPPRAEVVDDTTDFAAMSEETIEKLTRLLFDFDCPEL